MSRKRRSSSAEFVPDGDQDVADPHSSDVQSSQQAPRRSKRLKSSPKSLGSGEGTTCEIDEKQMTEDEGSQSCKTVTCKKHNNYENRDDLMNSRDEERERADKAEASNKKLRFKNKEMVTELKLQDERIKHLEISKLAANEKNRVYLQGDDTIRANIGLLFESINTWALNWAHEDDFRSHMNSFDATTIIGMLRGKSKHLGARVLRENAGTRCAWATAGCRLATESFLANKIAKAFLARPLDIPMQSNSGRQTSMEEYIHRVCDGMKSSQVETHLWMSTTLRSHYSPNQYADSIFKPIKDDRYYEARQNRYESIIAEWLSNEDSPLTPLLKPCKGSRVTRRKAWLIRILEAASKLSLQLWVQDSRVDVIDSIEDQQGILRLFNGQYTTTHSLMPELSKDATLQNREVDLLVWPRIQLERFDPMYPGTPRRIASKASVVIFDVQFCKENSADFEETDEPALKATAVEVPTQEKSTDQDTNGTAMAVSRKDAGLPCAPSQENTDKPETDSHQSPKEPTDIAKQATQEDHNVEEPSADSTKSASDRFKMAQCNGARSRGPGTPIIDLAGETETQRSAEQPRQPIKPTGEKTPRNGKQSPTIPNTEPFLSEITQAVPACSTFRNSRPKDNYSRKQESPAEGAKKCLSQIGEEGQDGQHASEAFEPDAASRTSSTEPQKFQNQQDDVALASMYRFVDSDPMIEGFREPLELLDFGGDTIDYHGLETEEAFTSNIGTEANNDGGRSDVVNSVDLRDEEGDITMGISPQVTFTAAEKPEDEANDDTETDPHNVISVDKEPENGTNKVNQENDNGSAVTDAAGSASTENEDDDAIMAAIPQETEIAFDKPQDETDHDSETDSDHMMNEDGELEPETNNTDQEKENESVAIDDVGSARTGSGDDATAIATTSESSNYYHGETKR